MNKWIHEYMNEYMNLLIYKFKINNAMSDVIDDGLINYNKL